jgi:hypothetical protein
MTEEYEEETITVNELEILLRIFHDEKKELHFNPHEGVWYWNTRHGGAYSGPAGSYPTALEAIKGAVEPYLQGEEEEDRNNVHERNQQFTDANKMDRLVFRFPARYGLPAEKWIYSCGKPRVLEPQP